MKRINMEQQRKKMEEQERKEREAIRRQLILGVDALGNDGQLKVYLGEKPTCVDIFFDKFNRCVDYITPLRSDVRRI